MPMIRGTIHRLVHDSDVLADNPLGDPTRRELPVYLPPDVDPAGLPLIAVLAGYGGTGAGALSGTPWSPTFPERYESLLDAGDAAPAAFLFPDAFTRLGGSQYLNSSASGRYEDHLVDELFPFVEQRFGVGGSPPRRGLMGKSSGGFGAFHVAFSRPGTFGAIASHSGDAYFELGYKPDFPKLLSMLEQHGGVEAFVAAFEAAKKKTTPLFLAMNVLAMAAAYSPKVGEPFGIDLPFEPRTGRLREDVWARWLEHDPVELAKARGDALRDMALVFVDCGLRDEFHLQYGTRQVVDALREHGVDVVHEEFDDGHMGVSYRYEASLPRITRALSA